VLSREHKKEAIVPLSQQQHKNYTKETTESPDHSTTLTMATSDDSTPREGSDTPSVSQEGLHRSHAEGHTANGGMTNEQFAVILETLMDRPEPYGVLGQMAPFNVFSMGQTFLNTFASSTVTWTLPGSLRNDEA
jgi:hypothetical protein